MQLTRDPVPDLIRRLAIPASVGFFFNTMYNVTDTWYAGFLSTHALAALSLSFPIFFILIALGSGIAQGSSALIANALGAGDHAGARRYSLQAVSFGVLFSIGLAVIGLGSAESLFRLLGADADYLDECLAYMNTILFGTVFFLSQSILNASLQALGDTRTFRNTLVAGFLLNLALDPWFMFGGFGLPPLGIRGVALATVLIQALGSAYIAWKVSHTPLWKGARRNELLPHWRTFEEIAHQGLPAGLNMMSVAAGIFVITWFVARFSTAGVAAYGIATRVEQIVLLPTIGLNIAVLTLAGQNNGAGRLDRVRETWLKAMKYGVIMMLLGGALLFAFARPLMEVFSRDIEVVTIGSDYLRIAAVTLCSYVILYETVFMLQGIKRPLYAIWIGLYRQILAPVAVFWLLAFKLDWGLDGIWWGIFGVTWSAAIITLLFGRWRLDRVTAEFAEAQPSSAVPGT